MYRRFTQKLCCLGYHGFHHKNNIDRTANLEAEYIVVHMKLSLQSEIVDCKGPFEQGDNLKWVILTTTMHHFVFVIKCEQGHSQPYNPFLTT